MPYTLLVILGLVLMGALVPNLPNWLRVVFFTLAAGRAVLAAVAVNKYRH